jgi:hypothetical protein
VYAKWTREIYTVTFRNWTGNESEVETTYSYPDNAPAKLFANQIPPAAASRAHYKTPDNKWYKMDGGYPFDENTEITGNIIVRPGRTG